MALDKRTLLLDLAELDDTALRAWSLLWENAEGWDSIDTIERVYWRTGDENVPPTEGGAYRCCWPGCLFARNDPVELWKHVHFSPKHRGPRFSSSVKFKAPALDQEKKV